MADEQDKQESESPEGAGPSDESGVRMVDCVKFGKRMEGLAKPPLKGDVGERVYEQVSKEAWSMWLEHSKMIVNEYHLDLVSERGQKVWFEELDRYFFGEGSQLPPDFVPQRAK